MKALKRKFRRFMSDDNGMEFIQVAVIILAAIALAGAAYATDGGRAFHRHGHSERARADGLSCPHRHASLPFPFVALAALHRA